MKYSKAEVHCKTHGLPALRFEDSQPYRCINIAYLGI